MDKWSVGRAHLSLTPKEADDLRTMVAKSYYLVCPVTAIRSAVYLKKLIRGLCVKLELAGSREWPRVNSCRSKKTSFCCYDGESKR